MKKSTWHKHHKWLGIVLGFFLLMFCLSGLVLNHPTLFSALNVSRKYLPASYQYHQWNQGLLRGSLKWNDHIMLYGNNGIWLTDSTATTFKDDNQGFPSGTDHRNIRGLALLPGNRLFAAGQYGLYERTGQRWTHISLPKDEDEKLCDITAKGDSLIVTSRSFVYLATPPYRLFRRIMLRPASHSDGKVSLFRTVWLLHSGAIFGTVGILFVDFIALVLLFLCLTGIAYWLLPRQNKSRWRRFLSEWHDKIGKISLVFTLFLCLTGWLLRPPALLAIASGRVPPLPFSTLDNPNSWTDRLRSLRYDAVKGDWLLYSSDGFYVLQTLQSAPQSVPVQPPVSVMGINVETQDANGYWLIGSFSGMYIWDRTTDIIADYYTHAPALPNNGMPFGTHAIAGYTNDFGEHERIADYNDGCPGLNMPPEMRTLPMSLRNVCLEIHTGRIYTFLGSGTLLYIFIIGMGIIWCLWSGWKIRHQARKAPEESEGNK